MLSQQLNNRLSTQRIKDEWGKVLTEGGSFQEICNFKTARRQGEWIVTAVLKFDRLQFSQKFFYDDNDMISKMETVKGTYGVNKEMLEEVIGNDILKFEGYAFPAKMIDILGKNKVIVFGEYHWVREEQELAAEFFNQLNRLCGLNQILLEQPNGSSWKYNEYLQGNISDLPGHYLQHLMDGIKKYKEQTGRDIKAYCISCNYYPEQYVDNLVELANYLEVEKDSIIFKHINLIKEKLNVDGYKNAVESFGEDLNNKEAEYKKILGDKYYIYVKSMTAAEVQSIEYRKLSKVGYTEGFKCREKLMKNLSDYYISQNEGRTLIFIGFYHAQKKRYMGTEQEWLAGYLKYKSPVARGETYSLACIPLKGTVNRDVKINLPKYSQEHELFKVVSKFINKGKAFLPLENEVFRNKKVLVNYHFEKLSIPVNIQFDGFIIIPEANSL